MKSNNPRNPSDSCAPSADGSTESASGTEASQQATSLADATTEALLQTVIAIEPLALQPDAVVAVGDLPRAPLAGSVHAEQFVVALASQRGEGGLRRIAVSAPPCGHCRQFCCELNCADELEFEFGGEGEEGAEGREGEEGRRRREEAGGPGASSSSSVATLRALLPRHFGPHDLARASGTRPKLLLDDSGVSLELTPRSVAAVAAASTAAAAEAAATGKEEARREGEEAQTASFPVAALAAAAKAALCAARRSHTPHTRCPAGLALGWRRRSGGGTTGTERRAAGAQEPRRERRGRHRLRRRRRATLLLLLPRPAPLLRLPFAPSSVSPPEGP